MWTQKQIQLSAKSRGFHLVTDEVLDQLPELSRYKVGLAHFMLLHTSAGLTVNENASPDVPTDLARDFDQIVPEDPGYYKHTIEGPDDMPAHTKSTLSGTSLTIPIADGALILGTWQGIMLCEYRNRAGARKIAVTLQGEAT